RPCSPRSTRRMHADHTRPVCNETSTRGMPSVHSAWLHSYDTLPDTSSVRKMESFDPILFRIQHDHSSTVQADWNARGAPSQALSPTRTDVAPYIVRSTSEPNSNVLDRTMLAVHDHEGEQ